MSLLSKNASNIYRPVVARQKLRSRFSSTSTSKPSLLSIATAIGCGIGFGFGLWISNRLYDIFFLKAKRVVDTTKGAIQDVKTHAKETKDEVKEIVEETRDNRRETAVRLMDLAKEKKAQWKARKEEARNDDRPHSEDETS